MKPRLKTKNTHTVTPSHGVSKIKNMLNQLKDKPIIINTDLDGIISGLVLQQFLNCKIVGFSNSAETIWLQKDFTNFKSVCFVDLFIANPDIICIDQHIVSVNKKHHEILKNNPNKINPNLLNPHFFLPDDSYYKKYPFGTIHFIIALLEREGYDLSTLNVFKKEGNLQAIDFILRADDTMQTTINSRYTENAEAWWNWLEEFSKQGKTIQKFKDYLNKTDKKIASKIKVKIADLLQDNPFNCNSSDGGITEITEANFLKEHVKTYFKFISELLDISIFNLEKPYKKYSGKTQRLSLTKVFKEELVNLNTLDGEQLFSYAFVRSSKRDYSFSCTFIRK